MNVMNVKKTDKNQVRHALSGRICIAMKLYRQHRMQAQEGAHYSDPPRKKSQE
jgi:hypothetical protein